MRISNMKISRILYSEASVSASCQVIRSQKPYLVGLPSYVLCYTNVHVNVFYESIMQTRRAKLL